MGKREGSRHSSSVQRRDSNPSILAKDGSLEIVSEESFRHRKQGLSPCIDCHKERYKDDKKSKKKKKKEVSGKLNSPIVVCLSDSIKVSVKGKMKQSPKSSDMESACSTDSEESALIEPRKIDNLCLKSSDLRTKAIKGNMRLKADKDLNEFLTAIKKVNQKGHCYLGKTGKHYKSNLLTESSMLLPNKNEGVFHPPHSALLNNFRDYHYGNHNSSYLPHNPRGLKFMDLNKNIKFVQNDLRGKGLLDQQDSLEESESASVSSTSTECHSDVESGSSSCVESAEELTNRELKHLSSYTSGAPLTRYECPPHECPECLTVYYAYTRHNSRSKDDLDSHAKDRPSNSSKKRGKKETALREKEVSGRCDSVSSQTSGSVSSSCNESERDEVMYGVTVTSKDTAEVSLADFHMSDSQLFEPVTPRELNSHEKRHQHFNKTRNSFRKQGKNSSYFKNSCNNRFRGKYHGDSYKYGGYSYEPPHWYPPCFAPVECGSLSVSVDLTDTDVTFTVLQYDSQDDKQPVSRYQYNNNNQNTYFGGNSGSAFANSFTYLSSSAYPHPSQQQQLDLGGSELFDYNLYNSTVGFFPYAVPYYLAPPYYYMCPLMMSIPRDLVLPRDLACLASQRLCLIHAMEIKNFTATQPPQRPWIPIAHPETNRSVAIYTVMCYNVLCDKYCTTQLYGYCPSWALNWEYRKKAIIEEIRQYSADIISLQEVETEQFYNFFLPELKRDGYNGIFSPKSRAKTMSELEKKHVDGCAIFFRATKFSLIKEHLVEFNQLAMSNAEGSHDMINRVMTKDNIGLAALLETKEVIWDNGVPSNTQGKMPILVATCHVHWDPEYSDVKLIQTMMLMSELKNIVEESGMSLRPGSSTPDTNSMPLLLCGDLNSLPDSGVVEYLTSGKVSANHTDFRGRGYIDCLTKLNMAETNDLFTHSFRLMQAYEKNILPYTNYTFDFKGIIDYIFFSKDFMRPLGVLGPLDQEWFRDNKVTGCPHPHIPSDHLPLLVEVEMSASPAPAPSSRHQSNARR